MAWAEISFIIRHVSCYSGNRLQTSRGTRKELGTKAARLVRGFEGLDVGDRVRVQLVSTDVERGFVDFQRVGPS
jgi:hypothetical protein